MNSESPRARGRALIVDDDDTLRRVVGDRLRHWGVAVVEAPDGESALEIVSEQDFDLVLLDLAMPGMSGLEVLDRLRAGDCPADVVVLTAHGSLDRAVEAVKRGADDFLTKPTDFELLRKAVDRSLEKQRLRKANRALAEQAGAGEIILGPSATMRELIGTSERAAASGATLLLTAESGCGKQVLAEHIHATSDRSDGPFVHINCVAIADELIESTLFGHERGAFTGAIQRKAGRLEAAAGGTAFLDEVGDISPRLQTKLLHFLESGTFERVGGSRTIHADCRVIAATNRDLAAAVEEGSFREDLYYRLNVIRLEVPPLRARPEDVPVLAGAFLDRFAGELKRGSMRFDPEVLAILCAYAWPGNVRQLKNAVERMVVLATGPELSRELLPDELRGAASSAAGDLSTLPYKEAVGEFKRRVLKAALARSGGNQTKAAEELGLQRSYLNRLIRDLDLDPPAA